MSGGRNRPVLEDVSVVIPTLGRPILERSLEAIASGSSWPARLVVVDQGCRSEVEAMLARLADEGLVVDYVPSQQRGRAAGLNRGIERVSTRFLVITDDDCLVEAEWLESLTDRLRAEPGALVTGRIEAAEGGQVPVRVTSRTVSVQRRPRLSFDSLSGGNMGAARQLLVELGMFDEDPSTATAEDAELAYRALRARIPLIFEPRAGVAHLDWREGEERTEQYESYARSHGAFYGRYLRQGDLFVAVRMALHQFRATRRWILGSIHGDHEAARIGRAYAENLLGGAICGWRHGSPPGRPVLSHDRGDESSR